LHEWTPVEVDGLLQVRGADGAVVQTRVAMASAYSQVSLKLCRVEGKIARLIELNFLVGDEKKRRMCRLVADRSAEIHEGLAEIVPRRLFRVIGPQEPDERISAMGAVAFDGKISEERTRLVRSELDSSTVGQRRLHGSQHTQRQVRHESSPPELYHRQEKRRSC
jgi:hypothetical protein